MRYILLLCLIFTTAIPSAFAETNQQSTHVIKAENAWIRGTLGHSKNTAAYVTLTNTGDQDLRLTGVSWSDKNALGGMIHLHQSQKVDGQWTMQHIHGGIVVPAQQSITLAPRGLHIMLMQLAGSINKEQEYTLRLHWQNAPDLDVVFAAR